MTILISFFVSISTKRKLYKLSFRFLSFNSPHSLYFHTDFSHSQPHSTHSHPNSPQSHSYSLHYHPQSSHSPYSVPRFPIPAFTDSQQMNKFIYAVGCNEVIIYVNKKNPINNVLRSKQ